MRIAFFGPVPPIPGGIAQHGARLVEALRRAGHTVDVESWASQYPPLLYKGPRRDGSVAPFPGATFRLRWWNPRSWWRAGKDARDADFLMFPWVTPFHGLAWRLVIAATAGRPVVFVVHNPTPHERLPLDWLVSRWVLRRGRGAIAHGAPPADEVRRLVPGLRVEIVHHPPNLDLAPTALPPAPPHRLLFFGYVRPYKGLNTAVDALRLLRERGREVQLTVAGEFWGSVDRWRHAIGQDGLEELIDFRPGYVSDADVVALLREHHLVVAPYRSATQSGVVPIAFSAGRPVVATAVGSLPEVIADGVNGMLAPPDDPPALADAIERAIDRLDDLVAGIGQSVTSWDDVAAAVLSAAERRPATPLGV